MEALNRPDRIVDGRIHAPVKRNHSPGTEALLELLEGRSTGVTKDQVEFPQAFLGKVRDLIASTEALQGYWGVEIVKDSHPRTAAQHQFSCRDPVMTVRGDYGCVGILDIAPSELGSGIPIGVESKGAVYQRGEIAMLCVVGYIALIEHHLVSEPRQSADETSPERCVPISPGRTDGQTEDD